MSAARVLQRSIAQRYPAAAGGRGIHIYDWWETALLRLDMHRTKRRISSSTGS